MTGIIDLFVPQETKFFDMLRELSDKTLIGAQTFMRLIKEYDRLSSSERIAIVESLKGIEHECDLVTHSTTIQLNKAFLTPIDREDIHKLSTLLDDIMDIIYAISCRLLVYKIKKLPDYVLILSLTAFECVEEIKNIISKLGSKGKVGAHIGRIHDLERKSDLLLNEAFTQMFSGKMAAVEIIKLKDVCEWLESVCDKSEDIADVVENIVIKNA